MIIAPLRALDLKTQLIDLFVSLNYYGLNDSACFIIIEIELPDESFLNKTFLYEMIKRCRPTTILLSHH